MKNIFSFIALLTRKFVFSYLVGAIAMSCENIYTGCFALLYTLKNSLFCNLKKFHNIEPIAIGIHYNFFNVNKTFFSL